MAALRFLPVLALAFGLVACGSDPLRSPEDGDDAGSSGTRPGAGRGGSGAGGRGGSGGGSAGTPPEMPDYSQSPCYGEQAETLVYDLGSHEVSSVSATCRGEGDRTLFYVADALWNTEYAPGAPPFTQDDVNAFLYAYELRGSATSFRPDLGILATDELVFGALDGAALTDGKLPIFLVSSGGAGQGYLCSWCDRLELHLDGPLLRSLRTEEALSIAAHESFHAIHAGYDANEELWVDESLAEAAMTVNGYFTDAEWVASFLRNSNQQWGPGLTEPQDFNYGAGLLFGSFLWERGGAELLSAITREPRNGWAGIDAALAASGDPDDGFGVFLDMAVAAYVDDAESGYSFAAFDPRPLVEPVALAPGDAFDETLAPYGIVYVTLDAGARGITLEGDAALAARIALSGPAEVLDVPAGADFDFDRPAQVLIVTAPARADFTLAVR
jgi:hypothetical protein